MLALDGMIQVLRVQAKRSFLFFFGTVTMELIHAVGEDTGAMTFVLSAMGMRRGACCLGSTVLSILMWYSLASFPTPSLKTCG